MNFLWLAIDSERIAGTDSPNEEEKHEELTYGHGSGRKTQDRHLIRGSPGSERGSTPKALGLYGIGEDAHTGHQQMFDLVHQMRTRIITSPAFDGDRVIGAILFEDTMDRDIEGVRTAEYLWTVKGIVPFLKIDRGLAAETDGAQLMKPIPDLDALLTRAAASRCFGTKMRSFIRLPGASLTQVVAQQFTLARQILRAGLVSIVEPEVDIHSPRKTEAERQLRTGIRAELDRLDQDQAVILKLTLPEVDDFYQEFVAHPQVVRVLALSGGYTRAQATARLARNHGVIASFSRALTEGLAIDQTDEEFRRRSGRGDRIDRRRIAHLTAAAAGRAPGWSNRGRRSSIIAAPRASARARRRLHRILTVSQPKTPPHPPLHGRAIPPTGIGLRKETADEHGDV